MALGCQQHLRVSCDDACVQVGKQAVIQCSEIMLQWLLSGGYLMVKM
jgi:hypothetical protein